MEPAAPATFLTGVHLLAAPVPANTDTSEPRAMADVRALAGALASAVDAVGDSVADALRVQEAEFLRAFRAHAYEVQTEVAQLRSRADDAALAAARSERMDALAAERDAFRAEALRLDALVSGALAEADALRARVRDLQEDGAWLGAQLRAARRELALLGEARGRLVDAAAAEEARSADGRRATLPGGRDASGGSATRRRSTTAAAGLRLQQRRLSLPTVRATTAAAATPAVSAAQPTTVTTQMQAHANTVAQRLLAGGPTSGGGARPSASLARTAGAGGVQSPPAAVAAKAAATDSNAIAAELRAWLTTAVRDAQRATPAAAARSAGSSHGAGRGVSRGGGDGGGLCVRGRSTTTSPAAAASAPPPTPSPTLTDGGVLAALLAHPRLLPVLTAALGLEGSGGGSRLNR